MGEFDRRPLYEVDNQFQGIELNAFIDKSEDKYEGPEKYQVCMVVQ